MIQHICQQCWTIFEKPRGSNSGTKFCTKDCANKSRRKPSGIEKRRNASVSLTCEYCGKAFHPINGRSLTMKYCSTFCRDMGRTKDLRDMADIEAAWLAGLFDGEGNVSIHVALGQRAMGAKIQITNTNRNLLERVLTITGGGFIAQRPRYNPKWKTTYDWHATGLNAARLLKRMLPWLIVKKEAAETVVSNSLRKLNCHRKRDG
jgi:hypothetical protein